MATCISINDTILRIVPTNGLQLNQSGHLLLLEFSLQLSLHLLVHVLAEPRVWFIAE
jgi:hypothetical protein